MENYDIVTNLITSVGFPIACTIFLGVFMYKFINKYFERILDDSKSREDRLYELVGRCQSELDKLEDTLQDYVTILGKLRDDVNTIKEDIQDLKE